ncbi:hypothetical protein Mp_8g00180 [Marchantia polymorpha subsp. ruderalis]|uniref:Uncharacterized protein n=1 Tax=Marchantia polymorpha TaxID=3197 RepID=A0A2R6WLJ9_MARPO|nr:hypothetical protein MARPO_0077s0051 [Marchantia polymorpha]BBN18153.1 hypothetical protein Mp_8g00180 [Marchantia polymorpha subsp. ruderalis]|eukprot:PTQ34730.1 hypothetical protein MARPO_0077s0051 [Marchantia polymorpha]
MNTRNIQQTSGSQKPRECRKNRKDMELDDHGPLARACLCYRLKRQRREKFERTIQDICKKIIIHINTKFLNVN